MVPTILREGTDDICKFCGYTVFWHNPKKIPKSLNNQSIFSDNDYVYNDFNFEDGISNIEEMEPQMFERDREKKDDSGI